ncbi:DUF402 domain-containing protein [Pueribacillus sp. YX66]|uniref:nucleoside tri-diphosphate phosphatase n=1 Tax=Pueribacillus sp. YX66 TaxID=3229242 RepID=UPI00358D2598
MEFPTIGAKIEIQSYKHNGTLHRVWEESIVLSASSKEIICGNDRIFVTESDGRKWQTREPAICYFSAHHWFNVIGMIRDNGIYYYCNMGSPFTWDREALKYIDYDLDVKVFPDMTYEVLDEDEYEEHAKLMEYPKVLDTILHNHLAEIKSWINQRKGPFAPTFIDNWYDQYLLYR